MQIRRVREYFSKRILTCEVVGLSSYQSSLANPQGSRIFRRDGTHVSGPEVLKIITFNILSPV